MITFATHHTARETDREVARIAGNGGNEKRRALPVSDEVLDLLKRAQSLLATRKRKHLAPQETLKLVLEDYLERHDPVKKAERAENRKIKKETSNSEQSEFANAMPNIQQQPQSPTYQPSGHVSGHVSGYVSGYVSGRKNPTLAESTKTLQNRRTALTAQEKHAVFRRDGGRCAFVDASGQKCQSERWLHIHHVRPVSLGGGNDIGNLTTLCSFHHDLVHQLSLPINRQLNWLKEPAQGYCH